MRDVYIKKLGKLSVLGSYISIPAPTGRNMKHSEYIVRLALADFGRDPCSSVATAGEPGEFFVR